MTHASKNDAGPDRDPKEAPTDLERRIRAVLRADDENADRLAHPRAPRTIDEARFLEEARRMVGAPAVGAGRALPSGVGRVAGRTALVRGSRDGVDTRRRDRPALLRAGAIAATLAMVVGAALFARRAMAPGGSNPDAMNPDAMNPGLARTGGADGQAGAGNGVNGGSTYLGPNTLNPSADTQDRDGGARNGQGTAPLPSTVDWSGQVQVEGPYLVRISHTGPVRLDETRELTELEASTPLPQWSCPTNQYDLLPEIFWVEVYLRNDPPGADPIWRRKFSRP